MSSPAVTAWLEGTGEDGTPSVAVVEIAADARHELTVRRRGVSDVLPRRLPVVELPSVDRALIVRADDEAFAFRLFADPAVSRTLPAALRDGGEVAIHPRSVRVSRNVIDGAVPDAIASARALAMLVVTALKL